MIGCKNCVNVCSDMFMIEEDFGRARACNQHHTSHMVINIFGFLIVNLKVLWKITTNNGNPYHSINNN